MIKTISLKSGLYLVATPIGNLGDITIRALETLHSVDVIFCEDKRVSAKLLNHYQINKPLHSYHDHNGEQVRPEILKRLEMGERIALISDAGTPLIADPGYKLVRDVAAANYYISALPGPCAAIMALTLSALPTNRFQFIGFLPVKSMARKASLNALKAIDCPLIIYESGPRLLASLKDMAEILGNRQVAVTRELTKLFEEVRRGDLLQIIQTLEEKIRQGELSFKKGELTIIVAPSETSTTDEVSNPLIEGNPASIETLILNDLAAKMGLKEIAAKLSQEFGLEKRKIYQLALNLKAKMNEEG